MPLQVNVKAEAPKRVVYPSLEDTRAALRTKGIDPDVIQRAMTRATRPASSKRPLDDSVAQRQGKLSLPLAYG
jgi:hypothetical protein